MKPVYAIPLIVSLLSASPQIKVDNVSFDFGTVPSGNGELRHSFKITNTGDQTLKIDNVKPGCSCTVVEFKPELKPGETSVIVAALSIKDRTGKQDKPITIISNAENSPLLKLSMQAYILGPVNMDRRYGIFKAPMFGSSIKDSITILSTKKDLKITKAWYSIRSTASNASATAKKVPVTVSLIPTKKVQSSKATEFIMKFSFKVNPPESEAGSLFFQTNHPEMSVLEFRCMIEK